MCVAIGSEGPEAAPEPEWGRGSALQLRQREGPGK